MSVMWEVAKRGATVLTVVMLFASIASAQTGTVAGSVTDSTGGVLPGVTVEAASPVLIEGIRTVVTDGEGLYSIVNLRGGLYNVTFTLPGFSTFVREEIVVAAGVTTNVSAELTVGSVEETITVTGASPLVDVQSATQHEELTRDILDDLPTGRHWGNYIVLIPGVSTNRHDVGGSSEMSAANPSMGIHGSTAAEMPLIFDGMRYANIYGVGGASSGPYMVNNGIIDEISVNTSGGGADQEVGGVVANIIPKQGGNDFSAFTFYNLNTDELQANNLDDDLRARGARTASVILKTLDFNVGAGGPLKRDRLWFYASFRRYGIDDAPTGALLDTDPFDHLFTPGTESSINGNRIKNGNLRLTWQAHQEHKLTFYADDMHRFINASGLNSRVDRAATRYFDDPVDRINQSTWTWAVSNSLLIEVGETYKPDSWQFKRHAENRLDLPPIIDNGLGTRYRSTRTTIRQDSRQYNGKASVTWVTGSHNLKVGTSWFHGKRTAFTNHGVIHDQNLIFVNEVPFRVRQFNSPATSSEDLDANIGIYAQEQWTLDQLTVNVGVRFDYINMGIPEQIEPDRRFVGARTFAAIPDIVSWKDLSPRLGVSYDLRGDGRTAIKWNMSRFIEAQAANFIQAINPTRARAVAQTDRDWNDSVGPGAGNYLPDCDLVSPLANGECGAQLNPSFGAAGSPPIRYDPEAVNGWGTRGYNWETMTGIQHQLSDEVSVEASYHRRWFGNFRANDYTLATPSDYTNYSVSAPVDARLPGGGGALITDLYDINSTALRADTTIRRQQDFGDAQTQVFDGVDTAVNFRFEGGATLQGGSSTGRVKTNACFVVDDPQALRHCEVTPPFQTQVKFAGVYPLPWGDVMTSATYQTLVGTEILANWTIPASTIPSELGARPKNPSIPLVSPGTLYGDRLHQVDFRISKIFRFLDQGRVQGMVDIYNMFNTNPVLRQNNTFGPAWQGPITILTGRLLKFGFQFDW